MKHWKEGFFLLPAAGLMVAATAGFCLNTPVFSKITYPTNTVEAAEEQTTKEGNYTDGIYQGTGTGYKGDVTVEVQVKNHQITTIEVLSYVDDKMFFKRAKKLIDTIIEQQTWEVDAVSGATYSSRGIKEAVQNALTGSTEKSEPESKGRKRELTTTEYEGGNWADGVYRGSAKGYGGTITVEVTITGGSIADIQVVEHAKETPSYFEKAMAIVPRILESQSPNVDTVSGATYSSNGIREAVIQALNQAAGGRVQNVENTTVANPSNPTADNEIPKGLPADGTYKGSAVCEQFGYTLSLKVRFKGGKAVSISGLEITGNEDKANEEYWEKAWKPMVKRI
ncbi:MAG: FMN-binding protein [Lachnospiraceae bacterium]